MTFICKHECTKYKAVKGQHTGRYEKDHSRCQICEIYIIWDGIFCPCCSCRLRKKPRAKFNKERLCKIKAVEKPIEVSNKSFKKEKK